MLTLTKEELKSHQNAKVYYICGKILLIKFANDKHYRKVRDHCHYNGKYRGAASNICNLKSNMPIETPAVFHKDSNYDYLTHVPCSRFLLLFLKAQISQFSKDSVFLIKL